jgi:hypothetical protein
MKLEIWVDGSLDIMHVVFFSSYVEKVMVALATNRLKTWQINNICD